MESMNKILPKQFSQYYEMCCKDKKAKSRIHLLENKHLKINADCLDQDDWAPLIMALNICPDLHFINIYSKYLNKNQLNTNRSRFKESIKPINEPDFLKESVLKPLIETLSKFIANSNILCSIRLEGFPLNNGYMKSLINGLQSQSSLQHLALPYCIISEDDLISLCRKIVKHTGLKTIDLSGCNIKIQVAKEIAALIRSQKLARFGEIWKQSLRYHALQPDALPGIRRLTLNDNLELGDEGFKVITYEIFDDLWIIALDFQNCGITDATSNYAIDLIKVNSVLRILDLRKNRIPNHVVEKLMSSLRKDDINGENSYNWLSSTNTSQTTIVRSTPKNKNFLTERTYSAPTMKIADTVMKRTLKENKNYKSFQDVSHKNELSIANYKSKHITDELKRTKNFLCQVSSKLSEERVKREAIEREHQQCSKKLQGIRKCLEQHGKINRDGSQIKTLDNAPNTFALIVHEKIKKKHRERQKLMKKYECNNVTKLKKKEIKKKENNDLLINKQTNSTKMFLLAPDPNSDKPNNCDEEFKKQELIRRLINLLNK